MPEVPPEIALKIGLLYLGLLLAGLFADGLICLWLLRHPPELPQLSARTRRSPFTWSQLGALMLLLLVSQAFGLAGLALAQRQDVVPDPVPDTALLALQSILVHGALLLAIVLGMYRNRLGWRRAFGLRLRELPARAVQGAVFYLAMVPPFLAALFVSYLAMRRFGVEIEPQDVVDAFIRERVPWVRAYFLVLALLIAPVAEELLFRGILLRLAAKRFGVGPAIALCSACFAAIHFHLPATLPLFVIASAFALAYIYTGSILVPIVMHAIFNGVNMWLLRMLR